MSGFSGEPERSSRLGRTGNKKSRRLQAPGPRLAASPDRTRSPSESRKGKQWESEEIDLLVRLRKEQKLAWSEVAKRFAENFPGRTGGSIQVY
jgi:hypothetical protein